MKYKKNKRYNATLVIESTSRKCLIFSIIALVVLFPVGVVLLLRYYQIYRVHKYVNSLSEREKWIYQKALDSGMRMVDLEKAVAWNSGKIVNLRLDLPRSLRKSEDREWFKKMMKCS